MKSQFIKINNLQLHYLTEGEGEAVLMLHGFPTSSYLWRNVIPEISKTHQTIALDLPGFGESNKSLDHSYSFNFYDKIIDGFLEKLGIAKVTLVVHDLGGPLGLLWAVRHPEKVQRLVFLNTIVYPNFSWGVKLFMVMTRLPFIKNWLSSPAGIAWAMKFGVSQKQNLTEAILQKYQAPFEEPAHRKALLKTVNNLSLKAFDEIMEKLPQFKIPVRLIYGKEDRILPKVTQTMQRLQTDFPKAQLTALSNCGHFLQEDEPQKVGQLIREFLLDDEM